MKKVTGEPILTLTLINNRKNKNKHYYEYYTIVDERCESSLVVKVKTESGKEKAALRMWSGVWYVKQSKGHPKPCSNVSASRR